MAATDIIQLYAPLVGLLGVTFWLGVLSERVRSQGGRIKALEDGQSEHTDQRGGDHDMLVRIETQLNAMKDRLDSFDRAMQGVQRQIASVMTGKGSARIIEIGGDST